MENQTQISIDDLMAMLGRKEVERQFLIAENQRLRQELEALKPKKEEDKT